MSEHAPYIDIQWLDLHTRGIGLHQGNIMFYFYSSPFFDISSNNQTIMGRTSDWKEQTKLLESMLGLQYILDEYNIQEPNLFVIKKILRQSVRVFEVLQVYYCFEGVIYQGPGLLDLIKSRISKASYYLLKSFLKVKETASYSDKGHHIWTTSITENEEKKNSKETVLLHNSSDLYIHRGFPSMVSITRDLLEGFMD